MRDIKVKLKRSFGQFRTVIVGGQGEVIYTSERVKNKADAIYSAKRVCGNDVEIIDETIRK